MARTLSRRALLILPILFGMSIIVFSVVRLVPGDPAVSILGPNATPALIASTRKELGLDVPAYVQYFQWLGGVLHGDFGYDFNSGTPISRLILAAAPVTAELVLFSMLLAVVIGIPLGVVSARWKGAWPDWAGYVLSMSGISAPDFWIGIMLILVFGVVARIAPSSGWVSLTQDPLANLQHIVLPALALAATRMASIIRLTRATMLNVLQDEDYIRFLRAWGLSEWSVLVRHALRNAAIPTVTVVGMQAGYAFGATVVIEQLFALPGLGRLVLTSTLAKDYPLVQASILVLGLWFIVINLVVDSLYVVLDPRQRTRGA